MMRGGWFWGGLGAALFGISAAMAQGDGFDRSRQSVEAKCGGCHTIGSAGMPGPFEDMVTSFSWPMMPLRVWLDSQHKPRIPTVDMSESDAEMIQAYIDRLGQQGNTPTAIVGPGEAEADFEGLDAPEPKFDKPVSGVESDRVVGDHDEVLLQRDCLNCNTDLHEPLN